MKVSNYDKFITNILETRGRFNVDGYSERHHIVPKCHDGTNDKENLIDLTAEEHYTAHRLLWEENRSDVGLAKAFMLMSNYLNISSEEYAEARKLVSDNMKGKSYFGIELTEETYNKMSRSAISSLDKKPQCTSESNPLKNKFYATNGIKNIVVDSLDDIPEGFRHGLTFFNRKPVRDGLLSEKLKLAYAEGRRKTAHEKYESLCHNDEFIDDYKRRGRTYVIKKYHLRGDLLKERILDKLFTEEEQKEVDRNTRHKIKI